MSFRLFALLATTLIPACTAADHGAPDSPEPRCADGKCDVNPSGSPSLCAAIRGNGENIFAHFGSLARIVEHYGPIDGLAGGSSGSVTSFFVESIALQPAVYECGDRACSDREVADRTAFLLKSVHGYVDRLGTTDEGLALQQVGPIAARINSEGIAALAAEDAVAARDALITLLSSDDIVDLVNPELLTLLAQSPDPAFHVRDILEGVAKVANWQPDTEALFIRPGLFDFRAFADKLGRAGSFYAGYGPSDLEGMAQLLDACASASRGLDWNASARLPAAGRTCGAELVALLDRFRDAWGSGAEHHSRIDDYVGEYVPALISTSILRGDTRKSFLGARADYMAARPYTFTPHFDDVSFGYWGHPYDLATVAANRRGYPDDKSARFDALGPATWRTALSFSPAEPGLARALEVDDSAVSAGGWSDLAPTLVLQNLGCDRVVYVTRRSAESGFARGVARLLGMSHAEDQALFSLDHPSALQLSVDEADGVWCTSWNDFGGFPIEPIWNDAYDAPLITEDPFFSRGARPYASVADTRGIPGCSRSE